MALASAIFCFGTRTEAQTRSVVGGNISWPELPSGIVPHRFLLGPPAVSVGTKAGPDPTLLSGVVGATWLTSGEIVVGDAGGNRILFFDKAGGFIRVAGRSGDGPGEFRLLSWVGRCAGGTVGAYDAAHSSLTFLTPGGAIAGTLKLPGAVGFDKPVACSSPGQLIMLFDQNRARVKPGQHLVTPTALVRIRGPSSTDTIALGGPQDYYVAKTIGAYSNVPLGRSALGAAGATRLFVAATESGRVEVYDTSGASKGSFVVRFKQRTVSARDWERARSDRIDAEPLERSRKPLAIVLGELAQPANFPHFESIRGDTHNQLWIRTFDNYQTETATWLIVDQQGVPRAAMAAPRRLRILEIGSSYLLGVAIDSIGVERVQLYNFPKIR